MTEDTPIPSEDRLAGVLLGTAVGDALGLPRESLSRRRAERLFGGPPLRHRLLFGRSTVSDDTDHTCFVAEALLDAPDSPDRFARRLARTLRFWLVTIPPGAGAGTSRAIVKLWAGVPPSRSGVRSAGNGPAMRAAVIGAFFGADQTLTASFVRASTRITHSDPRAEQGALAVALAAGYSALRAPDQINAAEVLALLRSSVTGDELLGALDRIDEHLARGAGAAEFAASIGQEKGVSGYVNHTVPAALYCWLRFAGDFRRVVEETIVLGGDSDTTGAIAGALAGALLGASAIPPDLINGVVAWPVTTGRLRSLARALAGRAPGYSPTPLSACLLRNMIVLVVVFGHGLRRLMPPY